MTERQNMRELARKAKQRMIVEQDGTVTDVIARLVDGDAYAAADEVERQRLVLNAAATYRRVKEEIAKKGRIAAEV